MKISRKIQTSISILIIVLITLYISQVTFAYNNDTKYIIFIIDRQSLIDNDPNGSNLLQSLITMVSKIEENSSMYLIPADDPQKATSSFDLTDTSKIEINYQYIIEEIRKYKSSIDKETYYNKLKPDFETSFIKSYNLLNINSASDDSKIFLISGGEKEFPDTDNINPTLNLLSDNKWSINSFELSSVLKTTPSNNQKNYSSANIFLSDISNKTNGNKLELIDLDSLNTFLENTFKSNPSFSFSKLLDENLKPNQTFSQKFAIAPGTTKSNIWIFKEDIEGIIKINNASNSQNNEKFSFSSIDAPYVNIWEIENPKAGNWELEINNYNGKVLVYYFSNNDLRPKLSTQGPFPNNKPITLISYIADKDIPIILEKIQITAKITTESKTELIYELNDIAKSGDAIANDGYFSITIPALNQTGTHFVDLEINWIESGHKITSRSEIITKPFPAINITNLENENLSLNSRIKVAELLINIEGIPYSISTDEISFGINSNIEESGLIEIIPENLSENTASKFYVYFTPYGEGTYTVNFNMNINYSGEEHRYRSNYILISSIPPKVPPPIIATPVTSKIIPNTPVDINKTINTSEVNPSDNTGLINTILVIIIMFFILSLLFLINFKIRNAPYGYIYNDKNELLINFSKTPRNKFLHLIYKNIIRGKELKIPELKNLNFKFNRDTIEIKNTKETPRLRINNQPLIDKTKITERSWIGSSGKLFSIFLKKPDLKNITIIESQNIPD